jgi:dTDP-4-amino-4,6-dideoxygalactose transaminase
MRLPLVDLSRQYDSLKDEIDRALLQAAASTDYVLGEEVDRFEEEFAAYCGTRHCVGLASGTAAVQLALEALGVSEGDEVIAPANSFIASVVPVLRLGATPVLVDCDEATATLDVEQVSAAVTSRTRAVLAVHLYGQPADVDPLLEICAEHGLDLVEDACQAHGARYRGRRVGGLGRVATFSFYPAKNLGALGDAGAVTTDDADLAERIRLLRDHGQSRRYEHVVPGWNERLDTIQAAVLRVKLRRLDGWNELRRAHAQAYERLLEGSDVVTPEAAEWAEHVWHLYVVRTPLRDGLRAALAEQGIATGLHYPVPLHLQPALARLGHGAGDFPRAEAWADELLSLPMFPELAGTEVEQVARAVAELASAASASRPTR